MKHLLTASAALYLIVVIILATQTRYIADDYCQAVNASINGVIGETVHNYATWNGRYSQTLISGALYAVLGANAPRIALPLLIAGLLGALVLFLRRWDVALVGCAAFIMGINFLQGVLWIPGIVTYILPIPLALFFWRSCWQVSMNHSR